MKFLPDKVGGNPKQYAILGALVVTMIGVYFWMMRDDSAPRTAAPVAAAPVAKPSVITRAPQTSEVSSGAKLETRSGARADNFRPTLKLPEGTDVTKIDPTLKLELLAKLQKVPLEGGSRSIFDYGAPPVPPPPAVPPIRPGSVAMNGQPGGPGMPGGPGAPGNIKPAAPPIPLRFYGYANRAVGPARQAFFLDGDDIQIKGENDVIRGRYKIVRIGINSAVVEDLQSHDQQTLPLVAEVQS